MLRYRLLAEALYRFAGSSAVAIHSMLGRLTVVALVCLSAPSAAQQAERTSIGFIVGASQRGLGRVDECCVSYHADLVERPTSFVVGARVTREVAPRLAVDVDATWEPQHGYYTAYFQDDIAGPVPGYRFYRAKNTLRVVALDGRARLRLWSVGPIVVEMAAGGGWLMETRESHLRNLMVKPLPWATPETEFDHTDRRSRATVGAALVLHGRFSPDPFDWFAELGVRQRLGEREPNRSDLDLGRTSVGVRVGVVRRF